MPTVIDVRQLRKRYGCTTAVDDVSFAVEEGEIFGILGPNGAGKPAVVETIGGLRAPDAGSVRVLGLDPVRDRAEVRRRVGAQLPGGGAAREAAPLRQAGRQRPRGGLRPRPAHPRGLTR